MPAAVSPEARKGQTPGPRTATPHDIPLGSFLQFLHLLHTIQISSQIDTYTPQDSSNDSKERLFKDTFLEHDGGRTQNRMLTIGICSSFEGVLEVTPALTLDEAMLFLAAPLTPDPPAPHSLPAFLFLPLLSQFHCHG